MHPFVSLFSDDFFFFSVTVHNVKLVGSELGRSIKIFISFFFFGFERTTLNNTKRRS